MALRFIDKQGLLHAATTRDARSFLRSVTPEAAKAIDEAGAFIRASTRGEAARGGDIGERAR